MTDLDRRNILTGLAGGIGLAAAASAAPALAQLQPLQQKPGLPLKPRSKAPAPSTDAQSDRHLGPLRKTVPGT